MANTTHTLDPKMKAIYDQVMATVVTPPQNPAVAPGPKIDNPLANTPLTNPVSTIPQTKYPLPVSAVPNAASPSPSLVDPITQLPQRPSLVTEQVQTLGRPNIPVDKGLYGSLPTTPPPMPPNAAISKATSYTASTAPEKEGNKKGHSPLIPVLFAISGMIFFAVYAIFWVKFFGLELPFLPI